MIVTRNKLLVVLDFVKRQAEIVSAITIVLAGVWWLIGGQVTGFIDDRIVIHQVPLETRLTANQLVSTDTNRDVEKVKTDILIMGNTLSNVNAKSDRIESKLDNLIQRLIPIREGRVDPSPSPLRGPSNAN